MQKAKSVYCIKTKNCGNILQNKRTCNCAILTANNPLINSYKYIGFTGIYSLQQEVINS